MTDARIAALEAALASRPPLRAPDAPGQARAAVALLLRVREGRVELLLIHRAEREGDPWSGHMALPGGRWQRDDADLVATAARETREEVGIDVASGRLLGELDALAPRSARIPSIAVSPFVFHVPAGVEPKPNHEVQLALWIAVEDLLRPDAVTEYLHDLADGNTLAFPAFDAQGYVVWGMTHRILTGFLEMYAQSGALDPAK
ncbi:MAG TPA: CoA pyrophosphatase [Longimicrobium sp.]|nr:CoA pyrophosphatase [Longimicrobium sp.]